jgi:hypothetical protein
MKNGTKERKEDGVGRGDGKENGTKERNRDDVGRGGDGNEE